MLVHLSVPSCFFSDSPWGKLLLYWRVTKGFRILAWSRLWKCVGWPTEGRSYSALLFSTLLLPIFPEVAVSWYVLRDGMQHDLLNFNLLLMLHLWGMWEVGLIWQDQGLSSVMDRPFMVSFGPHSHATLQIPSCMVVSLPKPLAGNFWMVLLYCLSWSIRNWFFFWRRGLGERWGRTGSKSGSTSYSGNRLESHGCSPSFAYKKMTG